MVELAGQYDQDHKVARKVARPIGLVLAVWPLGRYNLYSKLSCLVTFAFNISNQLSFQIVDVVIDALRGIGLRLGNVNSQEFEDQGFWYRAPVALKNGVRRGTFRIEIQFNKN